MHANCEIDSFKKDLIITPQKKGETMSTKPCVYFAIWISVFLVHIFSFRIWLRLLLCASKALPLHVISLWPALNLESIHCFRIILLSILLLHKMLLYGMSLILFVLLFRRIETKNFLFVFSIAQPHSKRPIYVERTEETHTNERTDWILWC